MESVVNHAVGLAVVGACVWWGLQPGDATAQVSTAAHVIRVGPGRAIKTLAEAARLATDDTMVAVDAGDYLADVAVWNQDRLTLLAVGGRVRLLASGAAAEGKAIWVMRGGQILVDGFEFSGTRVADRNGAGIRLEKGVLTVRNSVFIDNENGILTGNNEKIALDIVNCEFGRNGHGDGFSHNVYVGEIASLSVTGSYFHHAKTGHLLKSRAAVNTIRYNRLTDENGGHASYELELPSGGIAYVVGNIIQQGAQTENSTIVSYGAEGYRWPKNELYLINNTLVDGRAPGGTFLRVRPGAGLVRAVNNVLVGVGKLDSAGPGEYRNNFTVNNAELQHTAQYDYRLKIGSSLSGKAVAPGNANGVDLRQLAQYVHPQTSQLLSLDARDPGAVQGMPRIPRP